MVKPTGARARKARCHGLVWAPSVPASRGFLRWMRKVVRSGTPIMSNAIAYYVVQSYYLNVICRMQWGSGGLRSNSLVPAN